MVSVPTNTLRSDERSSTRGRERGGGEREIDREREQEREREREGERERCGDSCGRKHCQSLLPPLPPSRKDVAPDFIALATFLP